MRPRRILAGLLGVPALVLCGPLPTALADAGPHVPVVLTVAHGGAEYTSVQAAVNAVPDNPARPYVISVAAGTYQETLTIPAAKTHLTLEGATGNPADVTITAGHYNGETDPSTGQPYGTEGSATVHALASDFTAEHVTFANTFDKTRHPEVGSTHTQAVAIAMEGDRQVYRDDVFHGHQDTLLTWSRDPGAQTRQYVYGSEIDGDVDFIFGNGTLVVDRSAVNALNDGIYSAAYLTAPATWSTHAYGILLTGSTVNTTLGNGTLYLGRAWRPNTSADPQVVIRDTVLPQAVSTTTPWLGISGAGWTAGRYGEYGDSGPGAATTASAARPQLDGATAARYTATAYLAGSDSWNPVAPPTAAPPSLGDRRPVHAPSLPATCDSVAAELPSGTRTFSAADEAAPPDTARIQAALDACAGTGQAVRLTGGGSRTAFLSAPLTVHAGEHLVLDSDVTLYASRDAARYQQPGKAVCGSIGTSSSGCAAFVTVTGRGSGVEGVRAHGRQGTIDGRGDLPVLGTTASWWNQAVTAKKEGLKQVNPRLVQANRADGFTAYDLTLVNSPKQHLFISQSIGATVWGLRVDTPDTTLNTDGVDLDSSTESTIADSWIHDGDDCVALTTNSSAESAVTVRGLRCYGTHGLSIGSGTTYGLDSILFTGNLVDGKDATGTYSTLNNGIRVKSYPGAGGPVTHVTYAGTCMRDVRYLIDIDPNYSYATPTGGPVPDFRSITVTGARATDSAPSAVSVLNGYDTAHRLGLTLRDVHFDATATQAQYADITLSHTDLDPSGTDTTVTRTDGGPWGGAPSPFPAGC